jgi:hypothetical protein
VLKKQGREDILPDGIDPEPHVSMSASKKSPHHEANAELTGVLSEVLQDGDNYF